jgi:hypothetical protein
VSLTTAAVWICGMFFGFCTIAVIAAAWADRLPRNRKNDKDVTP